MDPRWLASATLLGRSLAARWLSPVGASRPSAGRTPAKRWPRKHRRRKGHCSRPHRGQAVTHLPGRPLRPTALPCAASLRDDTATPRRTTNMAHPKSGLRLPLPLPLPRNETRRRWLCGRSRLLRLEVRVSGAPVERDVPRVGRKVSTLSPGQSMRSGQRTTFMWNRNVPTVWLAP